MNNETFQAEKDRLIAEKNSLLKILEEKQKRMSIIEKNIQTHRAHFIYLNDLMNYLPFNNELLMQKFSQEFPKFSFKDEPEDEDTITNKKHEIETQTNKIKNQILEHR